MEMRTRNKEITEERVLPITLEIKIGRMDRGEPVEQIEFVRCHFYLIEASDSSAQHIDAFVVDAGRMRMSASYSQVLSVHEVDAEAASG